MTQEHTKFLYKHKVMYSNFTTSGVIPHLSTHDAKTFLEIAKSFNPKYNASLWCGDCVMEMVDFVYKQAAKEPEGILEIRDDQHQPEATPQPSGKNHKRK